MEELGDGARPDERTAKIPLVHDIAANPGGVVIQVIDDDEVEPAVPIVIEEVGRGRPEGILQSRFVRDVPKGAVAVVQKQAHAAVLRDEHVGPAIVIDVADNHARVRAGNPQTRPGGHVLEAAVPQVLVEAIGGGRTGTAARQEIEVEQSVAVEIEDGHAGAMDLGKLELADIAGIVDEVDARLVGRIHEPFGLFRRRNRQSAVGVEKNQDGEQQERQSSD